MKKLFDILKKLTIRDYIITILVIFIILLRIDLIKSNKQSKKNKIIYQSEIVDYKNKLKEEYKSKEIFINDNKTLSLYNKELEEERKTLKDKVIYLSKLKAQVIIDTVYTTIVEHEIITDSTSTYEWNFKNEDFLNIDGISYVNHRSRDFINKINSISLNSYITMNIIEKNKGLHLIVKSDNPYIKITEQDASFYELNKSSVFKNYIKRYNKKKRFGVGIYGGYGLNGYKEGGTYKMNFGPSIGFGIFYNIWQF